jgi:cathepsin B
LTELAIKEEILANGPVLSSMIVWEDLLNYHSGIYYQKEGDIIGAHAVLLVGWGETEDGTKYWDVQNSWGADWGELGYFRIRIGDSMIANNDMGGSYGCYPKLNGSAFLFLQE